MSSKVGCIYKIQNVINNKVYIGQTIVKNPMLRWKDHYSCYLNNNKYPLYQEMNTYGVENFLFQIIEVNIPKEQLDEKENMYIQKYDSYIKNKGYNLTLGGQKDKCSKLVVNQVYEIIEMLKNDIDFKEIACTFGISTSTVSDINCGDTWCFENVNYPIKKSIYDKKQFTELEIIDIYDKLKNNCSLTYIAKQYEVSVTTISNINYGKIYKKNNQHYPIYKANNGSCNLKQNKIKEIIDLLITTKKNYSEIAISLNVNRKTVSNIDKGIYYKEDTISLGYDTFPLRKNN